MFRVGDLVKCVDSSGTPLQHGCTYKVEVVSDDSRFVSFWDYELDAVGGGWYSSRFVIAKPTFKGNKYATAS